MDFTLEFIIQTYISLIWYLTTIVYHIGAHRMAFVRNRLTLWYCASHLVSSTSKALVFIQLAEC